MITALFVLFILISVWLGSVNILKAIEKDPIPSLNILIMAIGLTAVITHIIHIW